MKKYKDRRNIQFQHQFTINFNGFYSHRFVLRLILFRSLDLFFLFSWSVLRYFWVSELKLVVILVIFSFWFCLDLWSGLSSVTFGQTINKCLTLHNTCCLNCPNCQSPQVDPAWSLPTLPYLTNTECFVHLLWNMYNSCKYFLLIFSKDKWVFVGSFRFMYIYWSSINGEKRRVL